MFMQQMSAIGRWRRRFRACLCAAAATVCAATAGAQEMPAGGAPAPRVVVVLAGGGAKGFAHLAVLRRLEQDHVPIHRIVGTSMGAVIGGLYASGLSVDDIARVIGSLDPTRVALDQLDRGEVSESDREYQSAFPVALDFGVRDGSLAWARGASDGQRFLALLQRLTAQVQPGASFDRLAIPFRAVATRYRDGAVTVFDRGSLPLAIRASMAAPGVFAPVEIDGVSYVDGGLLANLPVEQALQEGADVIVASYLGQPDESVPEPTNLLAVTNRMLAILIRQNEARSLAALRPQDILVRSLLPDIGFADFGKSASIIARGEEAVARVAAGFDDLARRVAAAQDVTPPGQPTLEGRGMRIAKVSVKGVRNVPAGHVERAFHDLLGRGFDAGLVGERIDRLYTEGLFERLYYSLQWQQDHDYELIVEVQEKAYGPNVLRTSVALYSDQDNTHLYSLGLGWRRPFVTDAGDEWRGQLRVGSDAALGLGWLRPVGDYFTGSLEADVRRQLLPMYLFNLPDKTLMSVTTARRLGLNLTHEFGPLGLVRVGVQRTLTSLHIDTGRWVAIPGSPGEPVEIPDFGYSVTSARAQLLLDGLDSSTFPTSGSRTSAAFEKGLGSTPYRAMQLDARWAGHWRDHVVNLGAGLGRVDAPACYSDNCVGVRNYTLGGFQSMGAFRYGQLSGDRYGLAQATYMYRLSDGGLLRQPAYAGLVGEAGDAWLTGDNPRARWSLTAFIGLDSKIGDVYMGLARGSQGNSNVFFQIGRRFQP